MNWLMMLDNEKSFISFTRADGDNQVSTGVFEHHFGKVLWEKSPWLSYVRAT